MQIQDLQFLGQARHGVYKDECEGIHPDVIEKYYGIHGKAAHRPSGVTGAANPPISTIRQRYHWQPEWQMVSNIK